MSRCEDVGASSGEKKYKGVRRRKWGKWVSEIRVPGSRERLWLGSYASPEAAAVAHDTAVLLLRGPSSSASLNFPERAAAATATLSSMSPRSVQRVASESGMTVDAELAMQQPETQQRMPESGREDKMFEESQSGGDIYIYDVHLG